MRPAAFLAFSATLAAAPLPLQISPNHRYLQTSGGKPFFWLADTGWLLFHKLTREESVRYLDTRQAQGYNVIQVMVLHTAAARNVYGKSALIENDPARPNTEPGGYWDHVDWVIEQAADKGIYMALVPAWGSLANAGQLNADNVETYTRFLANRYGKRPNVVWLTGGDIRGDRHPSLWKIMGRTLRQVAPAQLITYHPFGRTQSSTWHHTEPWLDFNMFQSGHRRYDQDDTPGAKGEDNWRYVAEDLALEPPKPTLDGEPSYERIPQGLHDFKQPLWQDHDVRRYAYWSVFAGSCGHTYGNGAVMPMIKSTDAKPAYGLNVAWDDAINDRGAVQMRHLKRLMLSRPYFERVPDQSLIAGKNGERYDYIAATRGRRYAMFYTYTGRPFEVALGKIEGTRLRAAWFDPRTGASLPAEEFPNRGTRRFTPPGESRPGNDWVLLLDDAANPALAAIPLPSLQ
ncbi:MAG: glycoside hydrolase family 140 protein [Bryobacteraceae bacterium]